MFDLFGKKSKLLVEEYREKVKSLILEKNEAEKRAEDFKAAAAELKTLLAATEEQLRLTKDALDVIKKKAVSTKKSTSTSKKKVNKEN